MRPSPGMDHSAALIETIAIALGAAFLGGVIAARIGLPTIVGYLLAGVAVGPFTPGLVADTSTAAELAELGVILLMFGVGIHFSIPDLLAVRRVAIPGAVGQILVAALLGTTLGVFLGWGVVGGAVLGLAVSVASTVVLLRALEAQGTLNAPEGRIAVGWLIVEDLFTVVVLVLLPALAPMLLGEGGTLADAGVDLAHRAREARGVRGGDAHRWRPGDPAHPRVGGADRLARAVHAVGAGHRHRHRVRRLHAVRRLVRAGRLPGGRGAQRIAGQPQGRRGRAAAARRVRGAVLRVGGDAVRPRLRGRSSRWPSCS